MINDQSLQPDKNLVNRPAARASDEALINQAPVDFIKPSNLPQNTDGTQSTTPPEGVTPQQDVIVDDGNDTNQQSPDNSQRELSSDELRTLDFIKSHVIDCITVGEEYRWKFKFDWDNIERQVRQIAPTEWDHKETWQSKVFVGLQAKTSESAYSNLSSMMFPSERFFSIQGIQKRDRDQESALEELFQTVLDRGGFYYEKDYMLEESIDIGTSFMKFMARSDKSGIDFVWRSAYDCLVDPHARHDWDKVKFWIDQYPKDISYLIEEINKGDNSMYNTAYIRQALNYMESTANTQRQTDIAIIRNIDGTGYMRVPKNYKTIILSEYWGLVPMPNDVNDPTKGYTLKQMVVTMINKDFVIRYDENPYGFIPAIPMRVKPRKYDFYGKGYLLNGRGTQELMNSMVNLGFDSQKITAFDIIHVDENRISDQSSIQYKPLAVWKYKGSPNDAVLMNRQNGGNSAMRDLMQGIAFLDQVHQDVTGVTRHSEGSPSINGKEGGDTTLGEYQLKLQAVDKRFLSVARRTEQDFTERLLRNMYSIIRNPKLFSQQAVLDMIGTKKSYQKNPITQEVIEGEGEPKLMLDALPHPEAMALSFRGFGVTQFTQRQETLAKLKEGLAGALQNPTLTALTNIDVLWRRLFQMSQIPDWEEIVKSPEEIQKMVQFLQQQQMVGPQMGGGQGQPSRGPQPPQGMPMRPPQAGGPNGSPRPPQGPQNVQTKQPIGV